MVKYFGENNENEQNNSKILLGSRYFAITIRGGGWIIKNFLS
jgi:hypothetical protein